jgi:hypothetical protein
MRTPKEYRDDLIAGCDIDRRCGDGEYVLWTHEMTCISADDLRIIADEIDRLNREDQK